MAVHLESGSKSLAYPDLPEPLGKVVAEYRIAAATAIAYPLKVDSISKLLMLRGISVPTSLPLLE
jgi:hypothetical protein